MAGRFSDAQLVKIGQYLTGNLAVGLGEADTDTVFLRAFSALTLGMVLHVEQLREADAIDDQTPSLDKEHVLRWFDGALASLDRESDLRGCTEKSGWAHATAHAGDTLCHFARSQHLGPDELKRRLTAIADRMTRPMSTT